MADDRATSSPKQSRNGGANNGKHSVTSGNCNYALAILRRFNSEARITGVVGVEGDSTVVKIDPGAGSSHQHIAAVTALRVAFPFCTVCAVENAASGETEIQILISTDGEAFKHARAHYGSFRSFRALRVASNGFLFLSLIAYVCLLHAAIISRSPGQT